MHGPIVYCAEWLDNGGTALDIVLRDNVGFTVEPRKDLLGGVTMIKAEALNPFGEKRKMVAVLIMRGHIAEPVK